MEAMPVPTDRIDDLFAAVDPLMTHLDRVVEDTRDIWHQQQADWIWFKLGTVLNVLRGRQAGSLAAALARGLLEQAAYWDWAIGAGVTGDLTALQCVDERRRMEREADPEDTTWIGWIVPPGTVLSVGDGPGLPRSAADAIARLGQGLQPSALAPLRFKGLVSAYRLIEVLTHGSIAAAAILEPGGGDAATDELAAAIIHVAAAGAGATVVSLLELTGPDAEEIHRMADVIAHKASAIHGLPLGAPATKRSPAKPKAMAAATLESTISRLPPAQPTTTAAAAQFLAAADRFTAAIAAHARTDDDATASAWLTFQLARSHLNTLRGVVDGTIGAAILPFSARPLLEEGTRWGWLRERTTAATADGSTLHSMVSDSRARIVHIRHALASDGMPPSAVDHLLGAGLDLLAIEPTAPLPPEREMFATANWAIGDTDACGPMYSVLSQFIHATPIATLHLQRDTFTSISAPVYAVAIESACRGFWNIARTLAPILCAPAAELETADEELTLALRYVVRNAATYHCMG